MSRNLRIRRPEPKTTAGLNMTMYERGRKEGINEGYQNGLVDGSRIATNTVNEGRGPGYVGAPVNLGPSHGEDIECYVEREHQTLTYLIGLSVSIRTPRGVLRRYVTNIRMPQESIRTGRDVDLMIVNLGRLIRSMSVYCPSYKTINALAAFFAIQENTTVFLPMISAALRNSSGLIEALYRNLNVEREDYEHLYDME